VYNMCRCGQGPNPRVGRTRVVCAGHTGAPGIGLRGSRAYPRVPRWSHRGAWIGLSDSGDRSSDQLGDE
jgi:hypothetical protein